MLDVLGCFFLVYDKCLDIRNAPLFPSGSGDSSLSSRLRVWGYGICLSSCPRFFLYFDVCAGYVWVFRRDGFFFCLGPFLPSFYGILEALITGVFFGLFGVNYDACYARLLGLE